MKIFVAGHNGLVGSAIVKKLKSKGYKNILTAERRKLDLLDQKAVFNFLKKNKPKIVIIAAAKVGGIYANNEFGAEFIYENLQIQNNLIHGAHLADINNIIFLGSSCVYPRMAPQPIKEEYLLTGPFEKTNEGYAIAKISGIKLCEHYKKQYNRNYYSVMPTNLYGLNDNYDLRNSHVLPALIKKIHDAKENEKKEIMIWGSGEPKREFLYVDDLADACIHLMKINYTGEIINIGTGKDLTITELAKKIISIVGVKVKLKYDKNYPDGTPRKVLDVSKILGLGWKPKITLEEGIRLTYLNTFIKKNEK